MKIRYKNGKLKTRNYIKHYTSWWLHPVSGLIRTRDHVSVNSHMVLCRNKKEYEFLDVDYRKTIFKNSKIEKNHWKSERVFIILIKCIVFRLWATRNFFPTPADIFTNVVHNLYPGFTENVTGKYGKQRPNAQFHFEPSVLCFLTVSC